MKRCCRCKQLKNTSEFYKGSENKDGLSSRCKTCDSERVKLAYHANLEIVRAQARARYHRFADLNRARQRAGRRDLRISALIAYGGSPSTCACCQETQEAFLTIDHVNGGGTKERKDGKGGGHFLYRRLKKLNYPSGFQVLCMNCNFAKGQLGVCPHTKNLA